MLFESVALALRSIWANRLRSFMTVLGNIVAVTSIVTVVSLIQGMNSMVSSAITTGVGADSFTIQRRPPVRNAEDEEQTRNNPRLTLREADAIRRFSSSIGAGYADVQWSRITCPSSPPVRNASTASLTSATVDMPVDKITGRPRRATSRSSGVLVTSVEEILNAVTPIRSNISTLW